MTSPPLFHAGLLLLMGYLSLQPAAAENPEYEVRTWTSTQGSSIEGRFGSAEGDTVTIIREDGSKIDAPLSKLSAADQEYTRHLIVQTQPFLIACWGHSTNLQEFADLANLVPLRVEWVPVSRDNLKINLQSTFAKWDDQATFRHVIMACNIGNVLSRERRRNKEKDTQRLRQQAGELKVHLLALDDEGIKSPRTGHVRNDNDELEEFTVTPELFLKEQQKWIDGLKGIKIIPYRQLLAALRKEDPRWIEALGTEHHPTYLKNALLVATLTGQEPPLLALRSAQREKLEDFRKEKVLFKDLATLPEDQTAALAKLTLKLVNEVNKDR
ncbi:MAG: hypothetical protein Q7R22_012100 [Verrucomicrobiota bacterium JB025]|nr:hypothetical protein [Verrucomicrobiota bacterium JB025]